MKPIKVSFEKLYDLWHWRPIRNCSGRFTLITENKYISQSELIGTEIASQEYRVDGAPDLVVIVKIEGGGLISYKRKDRTYLHTLNTTSGFRRKLNQLGINITA